MTRWELECSRGGESKLLFEPERSEKGSGYTSPHFLPLQAGPPRHSFRHRRRDRPGHRRPEPGDGRVGSAGRGSFSGLSPSGRIVYQTNRYKSSLWALPFSIETLKPTGEAFPIAENVAEPSVAADGTLRLKSLRSPASWFCEPSDRPKCRFGRLLRRTGRLPGRTQHPERPYFAEKSPFARLGPP